MVVRDFDLVGIAILPSEANPILLVNADTVLTAAVAGEAFQPVSWRDRQFAKIPYPVDLGQLSPYRRPQLARTSRPSVPAINAVEQMLGRDISEAAYHDMYYNG